jgi:hypothetical protein
MTFFSLLFIVAIGFILLDRTKHSSAILGELDTLDMLVSNIHAIVSNQPINNQDQLLDLNQPIFRSIDGKHTASSLEELLQKMQQDPSTNITPADADKLRNLFENLLNNEDENDEDDDEKEPWKK